MFHGKQKVVCFSHLALFISTLLLCKRPEMGAYFTYFCVVKNAVQYRSNVKWCRLTL